MLLKKIIPISFICLSIIVYSRVTNSKARTLGASPVTADLCIEFVYIKGGTFEMGDWWTPDPDSKPAHKVTLSDFEISKYEITVGQFRVFVKEFLNDTDYRTTLEREAKERGGALIIDLDNRFKKIKDANWKNPGFPQTDRHPVTCVTWDDAVAFCAWLAEKLKQNIRLPTEAEWEFAARNRGQKMKYPWGNEFEGKKLNFAGKIAYFEWASTSDVDDGFSRTAPVGSFPPEALRLYDMAGNVSEWCQDCYAEYEDKDQINPTSPEREPCDAQIVRGGSWASPPTHCSTVYRDSHHRDETYNFYGFRVVREVP